MLPPSSDLGIARSHFNKLPLDDINRKYFEGTPYYSPTGFWKKIYHSLFVQPKLFEEVNQFYPYQKVVVGTREEWEMDTYETNRNSIVISGVSCFVIFNMARRNYVMPFLREYGLFFRTHRVFRQYLYAICLPYLILRALQQRAYFNHFEALYTTHTMRLNEQILTDPERNHPPFRTLKKIDI